MNKGDTDIMDNLEPGKIIEMDNMDGRFVEKKYKDISGVVERVTSSGVKLDTSELWYNRSRFSLVPDYEKVGHGDTIKIRVDSLRYIIRLKIIKGADF